MAAGAKVDIGTGMTVVFGTSGFTGELISFNWSGISRPSVDTSHMGTAAPGANKFGNRTSIPGDLSDPGEAVLEIHLHTEQLDVTQRPPIDLVEETITFTFPKAAGDAAAAKWAAQGYVTDMDVVTGLDEKLMATVTVKFTGEVEITAATT